MPTWITRRWRRIAVAAIVLGLPAAALAGTFTGTSSGPITIPRTVGNALPYPSTINVPSAGAIQNVRVTLNNARELDRPDSIDIALTHGATAVMIISDAGDTAAQIGPVSTIFDQSGTDFSATACDTNGQAQWPSGPTMYKPINCAAQGPADFCLTEGADNFPAPGPGAVPSGAPNLGAFTGNQQGDWSLWIVTDCDHNNMFPAANSFDSWTLTITNGNPTAVKLLNFGAARVAKGIAVHWRTADETDIAGYNVWRVAQGKTSRVNARLIVAKSAGRLTGASYRVVDRKALRAAAATYRLQAVTRDGKRYWLGTSSLSASLR
jgi:hypothetical protein